MRIIRFFGGPEEGVTALVGVYANKESRKKNGKDTLSKFNHGIKYVSGNPMEQLYNSLASEYPDCENDTDAVGVELSESQQKGQ